jgi:RHS repeat-associated protein
MLAVRTHVSSALGMLRNYMRTLLPAFAIALLLGALQTGAAHAQMVSDLSTSSPTTQPPGTNYLPLPPVDPEPTPPVYDAQLISASVPTTMTAARTPRPTITVTRPSVLEAGRHFMTSWSTTNATSLTHVCTASSTGYTVSETLAVNDSRTLTAQSGWVGYPSSCTWMASGAGGTSTYTETMTTADDDKSSVTYIHTDGLGSPVARTNLAGTVISRTRYEPYGYVASGVQPTIGFTGHVNDVDTGLTYMQQRYYDPVAGRFLSIDPVVTDANTGGSFNRYAYANNSPYKYVDPDGRDVIGFLVKLLDNGGKVFLKKLDKAEAVSARRAGQNVQAATKSDAKQIEIAARGGNKEGILQHKGHELKDGSTGDPHFQTEGVSGHTFWGGEAGAVTVEMLEALLVPLFATPSGLAPGTLYGPGTPYKNSAEYDKAMREKDDKGKQNEEKKPNQPEDK